MLLSSETESEIAEIWAKISAKGSKRSFNNDHKVPNDSTFSFNSAGNFSVIEADIRKSKFSSRLATLLFQSRSEDLVGNCL